MSEILCFGDSNTYGLVPGQKARFNRNIRWTGILQKELEKKGDYIIEEGLCGRTTVFQDRLRNGRRGSELLPTILESHQPVDQVILMLGTNDCKSYYKASAEVIGLGIEKLIEQIKNVNEKIRILLVSPICLKEGVGEEGFDPEFDEESVQTSRRLKDVYQKIAKKHQCDFLAASDVAEASDTDREHLDEKNHARLAKAMLQYLS